MQKIAMAALLFLLPTSSLADQIDQSGKKNSPNGSWICVLTFTCSQAPIDADQIKK